MASGTTPRLSEEAGASGTRRDKDPLLRFSQIVVRPAFMARPQPPKGTGDPSAWCRRWEALYQ